MPISQKNFAKSESFEAERGATMLEYSLMAALIGIVCIAAVSAVGESTDDALRTAGNELAVANGTN